ncbi:MAG: Hpt domain-containing protein, partial [Pseudomonadota bacterium]
MSNVSDIAADFILEAGEIADRLGEELVELEDRPGDAALLNSVFRGFHTIKGGAGFLHIAPMVDLCHAAEEMFDALRSGRLAVDAHLLDLALQSLDRLNAMLDALRVGAAVPEPPAETVAAMRGLAHGKPAATAVAAPAPGGDTVVADDEFEAMLDALHGKGAAPGVDAGAAPGETIDDAEFEAMLDALHGKGGSPGSIPAPAAVTQAPVPAAPAPRAVAPPRAATAESAPKESEPTVRVE